ncbi:Fic family protein [Mucilaginibacter limnophilus]|uniref:Fic family protein n=1 Tax=Mucilaginibacter limnophilus TaxID=1932778 RepID=A0A437MWQ3_9SPHI|nr:Fic family protein [Mucilaginibacter limnophilus]RVU02083.1 Fic family protein [Mucilaginibacter limnophilus]
MKKKLLTTIIHIIASFRDGAGIDDIKNALGEKMHLRTLQRYLKNMTASGVISASGKARATVYKLMHTDAIPVAKEALLSSTISLIPISAKGEAVRQAVTAPLQRRKPVGYQRDFLEKYRPNVDTYLSQEEKIRLTAIGNAAGEQPAGTYARQILNRLLIDLSWNSSRLEGNTYSLLDTERLIELGETDETKSAKEAQMILNHKDAIEFMVEAATEIGFNSYTIRNLHAMLANNLLPDPEAPGRLRMIAVGITGSVFTPLAIPQLINEFFELILAKASAIRDPFEQAFFIMVHLPYLQPFDDVNKRVSRLSANIPFIKSNFSPLSFTDVPDDLYSQGVLGVYELNDINLLKDVFMWGYERSAARYAVVRQSLGEPDPFRLQYRNQIREIISLIIKEAMNSKAALKAIRMASAEFPAKDQAAFSEAIETELLALHEGNFARYRVSPKEFNHWKENWGRR